MGIRLSALGAAAMVSLVSMNLSASEPLNTAVAIDHDQLLLQMAEKVPGFGGYYYDEAGVLTFNLKDGGSRASFDALEALPLVQEAQGDYRVETARYDVFELNRFYEALPESIWKVDGLVLTDLDEKANRVVIAVADLKSELTVLDQLASSRTVGLLDAVNIEYAEPIRQEISLRDNAFTHARGGLQIGYPGFVCTFGFVAYRAGVLGMVTNSHCDVDGRAGGGNNGTGYGQPFSTPHFAVESVDPNTFSGGACPSGRVCRHSDSLFARHISGAKPLLFGKIAKTNSVNTGSLTYATDFTITGKNATVSVGQVVNKVGRTTGWSSGGITRTCANLNVAGSSITLLCQNQASYNSAGGDSGSPVFRITSGNNVTLVGIHWGSGASYSPIHKVEGELGILTVY
ncbi:MAG: hypothetical protein Tsb002_17850 [Wenzhouxiangellaceae bacterium]